MLDKLVISHDNAKDSRKLRHLLISTSVVVSTFLTFALIYSLFSQTLAMGQENLNFSELIAPPNIPEQTPPKRELNVKKPSNSKIKRRIAIRKLNIARISDTIRNTPKTISDKPPTSKARPNAPFIIGDTVVSGHPPTDCISNCGKTRIGKSGDLIKAKRKEKVQNVKKPLPKPPPLKKKTIIKPLGVINGRAKHLVKPKYSSTLKSLGAHGKVTVQVLIDENGKVVSAAAISGHKLLRRLAVQAARKSTFTPTTLSRVRVKVRGVIVYNFTK